MKKNKILITGANGFIGSSLDTYLRSKPDKYDVYSLGGTSHLDITNFESLKSYFDTEGAMDIVVHCAVRGGNRLKPDTFKDFTDNILMFDNLDKLYHMGYFKKMIHLGSGAEIFKMDTYYGKSKHIISQRISEVNVYVNVRLYGVFSADEEDRRFFKSAITSYINKEPIVIHNDIVMAFVYVKDLIESIEFQIQYDTDIRDYDCITLNPCKLSTYAKFINTLSNYSVPIYFTSTEKIKDYTPNNFIIDVLTNKMRYSIEEMYSILKNRLNEKN